ncbi:ATPase [Microbacterium sp. E-13]|uniref:ATPase n=1 Tax=Microbacterium sp. E-13 TaxID=3404048 RepID=UPI003CE878B0
MKNLLWFLFGIAGGFVLAHLVNKDPRGHEMLADVDARITEFTDRMGDAYREQEARFAGLVDDVRDAAADVANTARAVAADAADNVADAGDKVVGAAADAVRKLSD